MYIYFKLLNAVITCEEYPQVISVEEMKINTLEHICNRWEKTDYSDGTFTLSFKYKKDVCSCDNSCYIHLEDFDDYECYNCGRHKIQCFKEGDNLYLQNSGSIDIVCVKPTDKYCKIWEIEGHPNMYKWFETRGDDKRIFALHIKDNRLSDANVFADINHIKEYCHIEITECI